MLTCGDCGKELKMQGEEVESHQHIPDIYLDVWNGRYRLARSRHFGDRTISEPLPFTIPQSWAEWVLDTCGGAINISGIYRLPGMVWEWCLVMMRGDMKAAQILARRIDEYLETKE